MDVWDSRSIYLCVAPSAVRQSLEFEKQMGRSIAGPAQKRLGEDALIGHVEFSDTVFAAQVRKTGATA